MPISRTIAECMGRGSWVRRMFEDGLKMKRERGAEHVFDYTLGNPDVEPPEAVLDALERVARKGARAHGYMPNAGYPEVRAAIAASLRRNTGVEFTTDDVIMTVGSAGACNVILKSLLDPGDEVIVLLPFFPEYAFYVGNHAGTLVPVETDATFQPDIDCIAAAITSRTRAILLNTPNNPTGRVYSETVLRDLNMLLSSIPQAITVLSDEPYKALVFDGKRQTEVASLIAPTAICNSWSKSQAISGERIGYLALSPALPDLPELRAACIFANRTLGFVNAPALWQWVMMEAGDTTVEVAGYERKRNLICDALAEIGYEVKRPEGTFYVFLKTPIADDTAFVRLLLAEGILAVPGVGFGRGGYIRLSLTIPIEQIQRSLPGFERAFKAATANAVRTVAEGRD